MTNLKSKLVSYQLVCREYFKKPEIQAQFKEIIIGEMVLISETLCRRVIVFLENDFPLNLNCHWCYIKHI